MFRPFCGKSAIIRHGTGQAVDLNLKDVASAVIGHLGMIGDATLNAQDRGKSGNALYGAYGQDFLCARMGVVSWLSD